MLLLGLWFHDLVLSFKVHGIGVDARNSADGLIGLRNEVGSADGAGGMGSQPLVDALWVEDVIALGYQTQGFGIFELGQADGALEGAFADLVILDERVLKGGKGLDDCRVETARSTPGTTDGSTESQGANAAGGRIGAVADVDGEKAHEEKSGDQDDDDDCHGRGEVVELIGLVIGGGLRSNEGGEEEEEESIEREGLDHGGN